MNVERGMVVPVEGLPMPTPTDIPATEIPQPPSLPDHLNPDLRCHECGAYCSLAESILSGRCCQCRGAHHAARW